MNDINKQLDAYVDALIMGVLEAPSITKLPPEEKNKAREIIRDRFNKLIMETLLNRLNEEQIKDLESSLEDVKTLEEKIETYASSIPGLADDLENRLQRESAMLRENL